MNPLMFAFGLLLLLVGPVAPMCIPTDYTIFVEKPGCDYCMAINTTICMGFCFSKDINMRVLAGRRNQMQASCTYNQVEYRTAVLPGCAFDADAVFTYPVALSCHCSTCRTESNECARRASRDGAMCTKPVRHLYPYPGQQNYLFP